MAIIHLVVGFMGFGKTTIAKQLMQKLSAKCYTHDEIMIKQYGRNPTDFQQKYQLVDTYIKNETKKNIAQGTDVILDYGFWTHDVRKQYYHWAKTLTKDVIFHVVNCDMNLAKQRVLNRTQNDKDSLMIDEHMFDIFSEKYEDWSTVDNYPVVLHNTSNSSYINKIVYVKIDRPMYSKHPKHSFAYPVNYGFIPFTKSGDNEELDAYILGVDTPLDTFEGRCVGVVHRLNDDDDKLIVVPDTLSITNEQIEEQINFQEQWFKHILLR